MALGGGPAATGGAGWPYPEYLGVLGQALLLWASMASSETSAPTGC